MSRQTQEEQEANARLILAVLEALIRHDVAADKRAGLPYHCIELENAIDTVNKIKG